MKNNQQQLTQLSCLTYQTEQLYRLWARQQGINFHQLITLYELYNQKQCTQKEIIRIWRIPKQTLHTVCDHFIKAGIIAVLPGRSADQRERLMTLTTAGQKLAQPIVTKLITFEDQLTNQLVPGSLQQAVETMSKFNHLFTETLKKN